MKYINVVYDGNFNDVDIIIIPDCIFDKLSYLVQDFWLWLENTPTHKYWRITSDGTKYLEVETDTFVDWINNYHVCQQNEKACVFLSHTKYNAQYETIEF